MPGAELSHVNHCYHRPGVVVLSSDWLHTCHQGSLQLCLQVFMGRWSLAFSHYAALLFQTSLTLCGDYKTQSFELSREWNNVISCFLLIVKHPGIEITEWFHLKYHNHKFRGCGLHIFSCPVSSRVPVSSKSTLHMYWVEPTCIHRENEAGQVAGASRLPLAIS